MILLPLSRESKNRQAAGKGTAPGTALGMSVSEEILEPRAPLSV